MAASKEVAMRASSLLRSISSFLVIAGLFASPALARRTVIDSGTNLSTQGYCSPSAAGTADCFSYPIPGGLQIGANTYNSFYINSNGIVSLASIESFLSAENSAGATGQTSLSAFGVPVFSPFFSDGAGVPTDQFDPTKGFDGNLVASTRNNGKVFTVDFYSCTSPLDCGPQTIDLIQNTTYDPNPANQLLQDFIIAASTLDPSANDADKFASGQQALIAQYQATLLIYSVELTALADGFQLDFLYSPGALGTTGTYGFFLPNGASLQQTGTLQNRTFVFNALGELISGGVPEPATWMSMILGFAMLGFALRQRRSARLEPA
jgi:hypothetical protein